MEVSTATNDGSSPEKSRRPGPLTAWASAVWEEGRHGAGITEPVSDAASLPYGGRCQRSEHTEWHSHSGIGYGQLQLGWRLDISAQRRESSTKRIRRNA